MTSNLSVASAPENASIVAETVASLPMSFRLAGDITADVRTIDGGGDWPAATRAAIDARIKGVVVTSPRPAAPSSVRELARTAKEAGVPVILAEPYASDPAISDTEATAGLSKVDLVTANVTLRAASTADLLLAALRVLRGFGFTAASVDGVLSRERSVIVDGSIVTSVGREIPLTITGATSRAVTPEVSVRGYNPDTLVAVDLPAPFTARPARVSVTSAAGTVTSPTIFEGAYRAAWRSVHAAVVSGTDTSDALFGFADDSETIANAI